jgi:hypothetical protein
MARRTIKTMAAKMAESGKTIGKNVLDDTDLSDDPIISAIQSLRASVDDLQHNDNDLGIDALKSAITANTNRGSGTDGAKGDTGATGSRGPTGATGSTGPAGAKGDKGDTGDAGSNGSNGSAGAKGDKGDTGDTGPAGNNGSNGSNGSNGAKGDKGDTGSTGSAGAKGATGATGATGSLAITEGYAATMAITSSRGAYTLTINVTGPDRFSKSVALSLT